MSDFISSDFTIININQNAIKSAMELYRPITFDIGSTVIQATNTLNRGALKDLKTTVPEDIEASKFTPYSTEIAHIKAYHEVFTYEYHTYLVRYAQSLVQEKEMASVTTAIMPPVIKRLTRGWDRDLFLSLFDEQNFAKLTYLPKITGVFDINKLINTAKSIRKRLRNSLGISENNVKLVINDEIDLFLSTLVANGSRTNREAWEKEFGGLGSGYLVTNELINSAMIKKTENFPLDSQLLDGEGLVMGFYDGNLERYVGLTPQIYKVWEDHANMNMVYDMVFHNASYNIYKNAVDIAIFTGV